MAFLHWFLFLLATTATTANYSSDYDYIIVGGGTAGLTVANRLSEDPSVSILVIEPGQAELDNPDVTDISRLAYTYDSPIDWAYETTKQSFGGRRQTMRAGKALGGTSLGGTSVMNGAAYVRAENTQLDALRDFKIADWTWESLFPYYLKSEALRTPNKTQADAGAPVIPSYHGHDGPVRVGFMDLRKQDSDLPSILNRTLASMGVPWNRDLNSGTMRGLSMHPYTVDERIVRSDSATAYYLPAAKRGNLEVMFNASVERIVWGNRVDQEEGLVAKGVEVYGPDKDGRKQVVNARKEVILAAGAMKSSAILELSGVGNPRVLQKHGIPVQINLPSVGENLQDQLNTSFVLTTKVPITGTRTVAFVSASDLFGSSTESIAASIHAQIPEYAGATANETNGAMTKETLQQLFESQHDLMFNKGIPVGEFVFILDGSSQLHVGYWGLLPFSRGSVHITSRDLRASPTVNPNYGMLGWDIQVQIAMSKFLRRMFQSGELGQLIDTETVPGLDLIPDDASDETWMEWIGEQYTPNYHAIGTTSMLPREMGGVLDTRSKVYGSRNVRVVDSSVFPVQLCGHPTANIYAVGEWVADVIKEDGCNTLL